MNASKNRLTGGVKNSTIWMSLVLLFVATALSACGGGAATTSNSAPPATSVCIPTDPSTAAECGTLIVGLTDAVHNVVPINPGTLEADPAGGITLYPRDVHQALREYLGIAGHPASLAYPFQGAAALNLFG